ASVERLKSRHIERSEIRRRTFFAHFVRKEAGYVESSQDGDCTSRITATRTIASADGEAAAEQYNAGAFVRLEVNLMVALGYVLVGLGAMIAFGWFYAVSSVVADLMAGWRETRHRLRFPRQFSLRAMFAI